MYFEIVTEYKILIIPVSKSFMFEKRNILLQSQVIVFEASKLDNGSLSAIIIDSKAFDKIFVKIIFWKLTASRIRSV